METNIKENLFGIEANLEILNPKHNAATNSGTPVLMMVDDSKLLNTNQKKVQDKQEEKRLQSIIEQQFNVLSGNKLPILEEGFGVVEEYPFTGYGLVLEYELYKAILRINDTDTLSSKVETMINVSKADLFKKMRDDILNKLSAIHRTKNKNKNIEIYDIYFGDAGIYRTIDVDGIKIEYEVCDKFNYSNNKIIVIKEKKMETVDGNSEFSDFSVFLNGLPFIVIEVKSPSEGIDAAASDYRRKSTYWNYLACIGTDGVNNTFLSSNPNIDEPFTWKNYETLDLYKNEFVNSGNGLFDILSGIVTNPQNLLEYFSIASMVSEDGKYLKTPRVQQWNVFSKFDVIVRNRTGAVKKHFVHHTRTGKSFTLKIIANAMFNKRHHYSNPFNKIIIYTHDVASVMKSLTKEFRNLDVPSVGKGETVTIIDSKKEYAEKLGLNPNYGIYICNMQKINQDVKGAIDERDDILIFVDEIHTHNKKNEFSVDSGDLTGAQIRDIHFPNASILSATATPIKKKTKDGLVDKTAELFGECIDILRPSVALHLNLVVPLMVSEQNYTTTSETRVDVDKINQNKDEVLAGELINIIQPSADRVVDVASDKHGELLTSDIIELFYSITENTKVIQDRKKLLSLNPINIHSNKSEKEILDDMLKALQVAISKKMRSINHDIGVRFNQEIYRALAAAKLKGSIIPAIKNERARLNGIDIPLDLRFTPKFFWVIPKRESGSDDAYFEILIAEIRKIIQSEINAMVSNGQFIDPSKWSVENNIYDGVRFGVDVNESANKKPAKIKNINGDLGRFSGAPGAVTSLFEASSNDTNDEGNNIEYNTPTIDVLILVRKKLMGYDNPSLVGVFLDTTIKDPKVMLQLATRGTTKKPGKEYGFMLDLSYLDNTNSETYKEAMNLYDKGNKAILYSSADINNNVKLIEKRITNIKNLALNQVKNYYPLVHEKITQLDNHLDTLLHVKSANSGVVVLGNALKNSYIEMESNANANEFLNTFLDEFNSVNKLIKSMASARFTLYENKKQFLWDDYVGIKHVISMLLADIKSKKLTVSVGKNKNDIEQILRDIFKDDGGYDEYFRRVGINIQAGIDNINSVLIDNSEDLNVQGQKTRAMKLSDDIDALNFSDDEMTAKLNKINNLIFTGSDVDNGALDDLKRDLDQKKAEQDKELIEKFNNNPMQQEIYHGYHSLFSGFGINEVSLMNHSVAMSNEFSEDRKTRIFGNISIVSVLSVLESSIIWFDLKKVMYFGDNLDKVLSQVPDDMKNLVELIRSGDVIEYSNHYMYKIVSKYLKINGNVSQ